MAVELPLERFDLLPPPTPDLSKNNGGKMFGEPCGDKSECQSGICVLAGIGGVCSRPCSAEQCPEGYGCYGVLGAIDPGVIVEVCVPERNQLCTPCTHDSECATTSRDLCLPAATGGSFCARDCTTVSCPANYMCKELSVVDGGTTFKQCVPSSGACDCDASTLGAKKACNIPTPFGNCAGSRTCMGATGWSACDPPNTTDNPDDLFADENCDGIDGDLSKGILVAKSATSAADDDDCGISFAKPCKTIGKGLLRTLVEGRPNVYVQAGSYSEIVKLQAGKNIFGGYDASWTRASRDAVGHTVTITGAKESSESQWLTLWAHDLPVNSTIADLVLVGPSPSMISANYGASSYVVHARNATLTLRNVEVRAGAGVVGAPGLTDSNRHAPTVGASASMNAPNYGEAGGPGGPNQGTDICDDGLGGVGGNPGTNSCSDPPATASRAVNGGGGGRGGKKDTQCCCDTGIFGVVCAGVCCGWRCDASAGSSGGYAAYSSGIYGGPGGGGGGCAQGGDAENGRIANGGVGSPGSGNGSLSATFFYWAGKAGTGGTTGDHGSGGGGGGGAGGCDAGSALQNTRGSGGGGGGAGGCAARKGGGGGGPGGGSFGILAANSTVTLVNCHIERGAGGNGGAGGQGGRGQDGGAGADGGPAGGTAARAGNGGQGRHGGHAGGGGGGAGGHSYGIYKYGTTTVTKTGSNTFGAGTAGVGGDGGLSAGGVSGRDLVDGPKGDDGANADEGTCNSLGAC